MKSILKFIIIMITINLYSQENVSFSNNGFIEFEDNEYKMKIYLVNNIEELMAFSNDYSTINSITEIQINEPISFFIVWTTSKDFVKLEYTSKLQEPNGNIDNLNFGKKLEIAEGKTLNNLYYKSSSYVTIIFDDYDDIGEYQFHIEVYCNDKLWQIFILEFNLKIIDI